MPTLAVALVLVAAGLHVGWNALVKSSGDPFATAQRAVWLGTAAATPVALAAWLVAGAPGMAPEGWAIAAASGVVEFGYYVALTAAYRRGALSAVYPVARGSGAVLGVAAGVVLLGERLPTAGTLGVVLLLAGVLAAARPDARRAVLVPALLTGATIATYSALDRVGVRTGPPWLYAWAIFAATSVAFFAWQVASTLRGRGRSGEPSTDPTGTPRDLRPGRPGDSLGRPLAAGLLMIGTYLLVLLALQIAPLAGVAPLRESATVLAAAWGVVVLHERNGAAWRVGGAVAVALGAILLALPA